MSYDQRKREFGRQPCYIVEIYLDRCMNVYGVAPCAAAGTPGSECFNTRKTCQDLANFAQAAVPEGEDPGTFGKQVLRFSSVRVDGLQQPGEAPTFPTLTRAPETAPTRLEPGKGLGVRSSLRVSLMDHPWGDAGTDPYVSTRAYDPEDRGSFWGKLLARHPFYEGRTLILRQGYLDDLGRYDAANFRSRRYILHRISGPDAKGSVTIEAKDPLRLADSDRKQWPRQSRAVLRDPINIVQTGLTVVDEIGQIAQHFAAGQPWLRVGDEVMRATAVVDLGQNLYSVTVDRGELPTVYDATTAAQEEHEAGASVQACWYFDEQRIDDILYFLLRTAAGLDEFFLPLADWRAKIDFGYSNYLLSRLIVEPVGVRDLLKELTELNVLLWWDERDQEIRVDTVLPVFGRIPSFTDGNIRAESADKTEDVKGRVSQVWVAFGDRNPTLERDLASTWRRTEIVADIDAESPQEYGIAQRRLIHSPWLPLDKQTVAFEIATRLLATYRDTKTVVGFSLDAKDDEVWTGDFVRLGTHTIQDATGATILRNYRVLQVDEVLGNNSPHFDYQAQDENAGGRVGVITPDGGPWRATVRGFQRVTADGFLRVPVGAGDPFPDYADASDELRDIYAFISYENMSGEAIPFPDGTPPYTIV